MNCEPFYVGIIALNNGTFNSYNFNINRSIGFSQNVNSTTNTNLTITGSTLSHSNTGNIIGSLGAVLSSALNIQTSPTVDWKLDEANENAINLSATYKDLPADYTFTNITSNKTITSTSTATGMPNTVVNITSLNLSGEKLTLVGAPSSDDGFIINVTGNFTLTDSEIKLNNVRPERVLFNFTNASSVQIKTNLKFKGAILAPIGSVTYLNPQLFHGSIIAKTSSAISYSNGGVCGGGSPNAPFLQKIYCNGYQW